MSPIRRGSLRTLLLALAFYTMFAQPGLPACWLEKEPCKVHPHFSEAQAESPHSHTYLVDQALGQSTAAPNRTLPAAALVWLLLMMGLLPVRKEQAASFSAARWLALPEPPPPKFPALFA